MSLLVSQNWGGITLRKRNLIIGGATYLLLLLILTGTSLAAVIINEDFESYPVGGFQPASDSGIDLTRNIPGEIAIATDLAAPGNQYLAIAADSTSPRLNATWNFDIAGDKSVYFSFDILPQACDTFFVRLNNSNSSGPYLTFTKGLTLNASIEVDGKGAAQQICTYNPAVWYRISFIIGKVADLKYTVTVEALDGSIDPITVEDIPFRYTTANKFTRLVFDNSGAGKGTQYIDNIILIDDFENYAINNKMELSQDIDGDGTLDAIVDPLLQGPLANQDTIEVKVSCSNVLGDPVVGKAISLTSSRGETDSIVALDKGAGAGITDSAGNAYFQLRTAKSTTVLDRTPATLTAFVGETEAASLDVNFQQVVSLNNSRLMIKNTPTEKIWANGEDAFIVEVQLLDYEGINMAYSAEGPEVKLIKVSPAEGEITITPAAINANSQGRAGDFSITSLFAGLVEITAQIDGKVLSVQEELQFAKPVTDIVETDKTIILAPGFDKLPIAELPGADSVPADGISAWQVKVKLIGSSGEALAGRELSISSADSTVVISPQSGVSESEGTFTATIAKQDPSLQDTQELTISVNVEAGKYNKDFQYKFIQDSWGPIAIAKFPVLAPGESIDVTDPVWIVFNKPLDLSSAEIKLIPYDGSGNPLDAYIVSNKAADPTFGGELVQLELAEHPQIAKEQIMYFQPTRKLKSNLTYKIQIIDVKDTAGNLANEAGLTGWEIIGLDNSPPRLLESLPENEARNVAISTEKVTLTFDEDVAFDDDSSFILEEITGGNVVRLGNCLVEDYLFDDETESAALILQLPVALNSDRYYRLRVWGISDVVGTGEANSISEGDAITVSFKTTDTRAPQIIESYPQPGAKDISYQNLNASVCFDEIIIDRGSTAASVQLIDANGQPQGEAIEGVLTFSNIGVVGFLQMAFVGLEPDSRYQLNIQGVSDEEGFIYNGSWEFQTAPAELESQEPYLENGSYVIETPVSESESIIIYIPEGVYTESLALQIQNLASADKMQVLQTLPPGHFGSEKMYQLTTADNKLPGTLTVSLPYTTDSNGKVEVMASSGEKVYAEPERLYAAYYRSWTAASGDTAGEWVPLPTEVEAGHLNFTIEETGVYAIFAAPLWEQKKLIDQLTLSTNPFAPGSKGLRGETTFKFNLAQASKLTLTIYDASGRMVAVLLADEFFPAGYHGYSWDGTVNGRALRSGLYIYRLFARTTGGDNPDVGVVSGAVGIKN